MSFVDAELRELIEEVQGIECQDDDHGDAAYERELLEFVEEMKNAKKASGSQ